MTKKTTILTLLSTIALTSPALSHTANDPGRQLPAAQAPQATLDSVTIPSEDYFLNKIFREAKAEGPDGQRGGGDDNGKDRGKGEGKGKGKDKDKDKDKDKGDGKGKGHDKDDDENGDEDDDGGHGHDHNGYSFLGNSLIS